MAKKQPKPYAKGGKMPMPMGDHMMPGMPMGGMAKKKGGKKK